MVTVTTPDPARDAFKVMANHLRTAPLASRFAPTWLLRRPAPFHHPERRKA